MRVFRKIQLRNVTKYQILNNKSEYLKDNLNDIHGAILAIELLSIFFV